MYCCIVAGSTGDNQEDIMTKIKMLDSGEVRDVDNNEAHKLIMGRKAKLFKYPNRMLEPKREKKRKGYRSK